MEKRRGLTKTGWWIAISLSVLVTFGFVAATNDQRNFEIVKNLDIFYTLFRELNSSYVDETQPEKLVKTAIDGMLESLDPYTTYIPESDMDDFKFMTTGEYAGIGALITKRGEHIVISEPYEGFPAQQSGLKAGDRILEINGESMLNKETSQVSERLKGPASTDLKVKVDRPGVKNPLVISITRRVIQINPVPYYGMVNNETGIIILNNFTQDCSNEVEKAFNELKKSNIKSLILDLRGNPGGLMDEAVKIANLFLPRGSEVVSTRGKVAQWEKTFRTSREPIDLVIPITVLINRGSASASEIVAGALQDHDRAVVIGQRSFGKGLVQTTRNLAYNAKLKVTTAKYYIPSGRCIQAMDYSTRNEDGSVGVIPDSLMKEFKTKGGRPVFDGGGISPDITVESDKYSNMTFALITQQIVFDYATLFTVENATIEKPENFVLSDANYNGFKNYVATLKEFKYQSESQELLSQLKAASKRDGYYDYTQITLAELEKQIAPDINRDMDLFKPEISELLSLELVRRYYYQKGAILLNLKTDKEVAKAIETLSKKDEYNGMLNGTILTHAGDKR
jgi:carboxyl-terminal processing protease